MYSWIFCLSLAEKGSTCVSSSVSAQMYPTRFTTITLNAFHVLIHECLRVMPANYLADLLVKKSIEAPLVRSPRLPLYFGFEEILFRASSGISATPLLRKFFCYIYSCSATLIPRQCLFPNAVEADRRMTCHRCEEHAHVTKVSNEHTLLNNVVTEDASSFVSPPSTAF